MYLISNLSKFSGKYFRLRFRFMVLNATFNTISIISWQSVLLVEKTGVPRENHRPVVSHWQTLSHNVISSTPRHECKYFSFVFKVVINNKLFRYCYMFTRQSKTTWNKIQILSWTLSNQSWFKCIFGYTYIITDIIKENEWLVIRYQFLKSVYLMFISWGITS